MKLSAIRYVVFLVLAISASQAFCQPFTGPADSLRAFLKMSLPDTASVDVLNQLSAALHARNYKQADAYARQAATRAVSVGYAKGEAKAYQNIALTHWANGMYDTALYYHQRALTMFRKLNAPTEVTETYNKLGLVYYYTADYDSALALIGRSVLGYRELKDTVNLARVLNNLGLVHDSRGEYAVSTKYLVEGLQLNMAFSQWREQENRTYSGALIHQNEFLNRKMLSERIQEIDHFEGAEPHEKLANLYLEVADIYFHLRHYQHALEFYTKARHHYAELGEEVLMAHCIRDIAECRAAVGDWRGAIELYREAEKIYLRNSNFIRLGAVVAQLGEDHFRQGNLDSALFHFERLIQLDDTIGHRAASSKIKRQMAEVLLAKGEPSKALEYALQSYSIAKEIASQLRLEASARQLYLCYKALGDSDKALLYLEESSELKKALDDDLTNREIAQLQIEFETRKKEEEIDQLNEIASLNENVFLLQQQMIVLLSIGLLAIIVMVVVVNTRLKKIRKLNSSIDTQRLQIIEQNQLLEKRSREKELFIGEIHHRVKNNLQVISSLLRLQQRGIHDEQARKAIFEGQNRVQSMSLLHQRLYQLGAYEEIDLLDYMKDIFTHLTRVYDLPAGAVTPVFDGPCPGVDIDFAASCGLIVNEVYSNIFKHARVAGKKLEVVSNIKLSGIAIVISIADNGPGLPNGFSNEKSGFGLKLINMLAKELDGAASFGPGPSGGLVVTLTFPRGTKHLRV